MATCFDMESNLSVLSIPSDVEDHFTLHDGEEVAQRDCSSCWRVLCRKVESADGRQKEWIPIGERPSRK